jgi:hypothetical protein
MDIPNRWLDVAFSSLLWWILSAGWLLPSENSDSKSMTATLLESEKSRYGITGWLLPSDDSDTKSMKASLPESEKCLSHITQWGTTNFGDCKDILIVRGNRGSRKSPASPRFSSKSRFARNVSFHLDSNTARWWLNEKCTFSIPSSNLLETSRESNVHQR